MIKFIFKSFLFFLITIAVISCGNTKEELEAFNSKKIQQEEIIDVETYLSQAGTTKARLTAPLLIRYSSDSVRVEFPKGLHTEFFALQQANTKDSLTVESHIFSNYGRYNEFNNKVFLRDSVICYNQIKKDTLWCDSLWWHQDEQIIFTWGKFKFKTHDGQNMYGDGNGTGFKAKQDLSEYTLYKSKGTMRVSDGSMPY
jgi:hypothetical protein